MVFGWRRAFCTSVPPEEPDSAIEDETDAKANNSSSSSGGGGGATTPKSGNRFGFFSSSTPRLRDPSPSLRCRTTARTAVPEKSASLPVSPKLYCKTSTNNNSSPRLLFQRSSNSNPSSPRSPSTFSLLKSNLRLSTSRCGLCLQSVRRGRGVAIFTAECSHGFHFPCIAGHVRKNGSLLCPICAAEWKQMPLLCVNDQNLSLNLNQKRQFSEEEEERKREKLSIGDVVEKKKSKLRKQNSSLRLDLKVYDDDEPLGSLTPRARFNPIPESDENCEDGDSIGEEFQGFHTDGSGNGNGEMRDVVDVRLLPEAAAVSSGRSHETYAVVLRAKAPAVPEKTHGRAPIDLVTVVDVSGKMSNEKLQTMKRAMRLIVSSLSSSDRLSIVAFSSYSKRILPLRRMTPAGQRAARRMVEAMAVLEGSSSSNDAVKKAAKVLEDRRERNSAAAILLLSDDDGQSACVSTTRHPHLDDVAVHVLRLAAIDEDRHAFAKSVGALLHVAVHDLRLRLSLAAGSAPAEITAAYGHSPRPVALGSGTVRVGELCANEERELLIELKVPVSAVGTHTVLSVRCSYRESLTQAVIYCKEHALVVPRPQAVRSSSTVPIQRLRSLFVTTRALAESSRLTARNDLIGAYHMLISARALLHQAGSGSGSGSTNEYMVSLEAELNELQRRRQAEAETAAAYAEEKEELLTPTSAWRVAEKLAKVAIMRKSLNRVSDLHGFEDARF